MTTPFALLLFLATAGAVGASALAAIGFAMIGRRRSATLSAAAGGALAAGYAAALLVVGAGSEEEVLPVGRAKVFCEIDCHLAYTVRPARAEPLADGTRYTIVVRTLFDVETIAARRDDRALFPNPRRVRLVDATGQEWSAAARAGTPIDTPLRPGESYESTFVFDVPEGVRATRLAITEATPVTRLLIGHENSPLHRKTLLALDSALVAALR